MQQMRQKEGKMRVTTGVIVYLSGMEVYNN